MTQQSTRNQEVAWRMQAEAEELKAKRMAADLYEALRALADAVDADNDDTIGEIEVLHRYEREYLT